MTEFATLGLIEPLLNAVAEEGYTTATPIQAQAIPHLVEGRDVLGLAQTGTGKTAAFALPILQRLMTVRKRTVRGTTRALILAPTRELALQISDGFGTYGRHLPLRRTVIFGGVGQSPQVAAMARGVDILVATPGRLLDLIAQGHIRLDTVEVLVLDEADRMLDMGFAPAIRKIMEKVPAERHTLLFSATMPDEVAGLARGLLKSDHARVEVAPPATTADRIEQRVLFVERADKRPLLVELLREPGVERAIVFARTKHGADRVAEHLRKAGLGAEAIHGDKSQTARVRALTDFREGRVRALVATDIAARGIDVDGITHVINYDLPNEPESYVHRIGRTARAGQDGIALSLCDAEEVGNLRAIEKAIRRAVPVQEEHGFHADAVANLHRMAARAGSQPPRKKPQGGRPQPQAQHRRQPAPHGGRGRGGPARRTGEPA